MPDECGAAVPVPPVPHSRHCHVQPSLPSQPDTGSVRAGIVSQVRMRSETECTTQQNVPNFLSPRWQVIPTMQPQSLILALAPQWALVQKGLSASKLWKKFSIIILSRLGKVSRKELSRIGSGCPLAVVESISLEIFKNHLVVVG